MPLDRYTLIHRDGRLTDDEVATLRGRAPGAQMPASDDGGGAEGTER